MKRRDLTPEEHKLWRESNRLTAVKTKTDDKEEPAEIAAQEPTLKAAAKNTEPVARPRPSASLNALASREAKRRLKQYPVDATLDLHGLSKLEAYARVQHFIRRQHQQGRRHLVIITGKGKGGEVGVLRKHLPEWLNEPPLRPLISAFAYARPEKGGTGVTHVLIKKGEW